jgi:hypothetical protein
MFINFRFAYLALTLPFVLFWALLFIVGKKTRKEQLLMSLIIMFSGPISEIFYFKDYWFPESVFQFSFFGWPVLIEDLIFGFTIGGIGSIIYEVIFRKHLDKTKKPINYKIGILIIFIICAVIAFLLFKLGINSIYASSIGFIIGAVLMLIQRKDLLLDSLFSGLLVMALMFISYFILGKIIINSEDMVEYGWFLYDSGLGFQVLGIPFTEMIWGLSWGFVAGPLYEFVRKLKVKG